MPNTILESIACGTPVAAFEIGGIPDMVKTGYNGYLSKPFDCEDLANSIIKSTQLRKPVSPLFNNDDIINKWMALYKSVIKY